MAKWAVEFSDEFEVEFFAFDEEVQDELLALAKLLADFGPQLGRPWVDTLKGSRYANMKEMRFATHDGTWRAAFAFDPRRRAMILVAGSKSGTSQTRFYRDLIAKADRRYSAHIGRLLAKRTEH